MDEQRKHKQSNCIRKVFSRHNSIEQKAGSTVHDSIRFVGFVSGFICAAQSPCGCAFSYVPGLRPVPLVLPGLSGPRIVLP